MLHDLRAPVFQHGRMENEKFIRWIRAGLQQHGKTQVGLAKCLGVAHPQITRLLKGERGIKVHELPKIADYLGLPIPDVNVAPLVGRVSAGAAIEFFDDHEKGAGHNDEALPPGMGPDTVAVRVQGNSMLPDYRDGDLLFYDTIYEAIPEHFVGRELIIRLATGETLVKKLLRGSRPGLWTLDSYNAELIQDVVIEWVAPFQMLRRSR